jgi:16S rRNA (guanine527-N7)-methyltransferase
MEALKDSARALGVELDDAQVRAFRVYADELLAWNAKFNLTAITDRAEIDRKHFLDSLSALSVIRSLNHDTHAAGESLFASPSSNLRVLDVGAGAGFPAVPLKLACPDWRVTLLEATRKKCDFLEHLLIVLALQDTRVIWGRAETAGRTSPVSSKVPASLDAGTAVTATGVTPAKNAGRVGPAAHRPTEREQYDLVVARAVAELNVLAEFMLPFARVGGHCIAWKGDVEAEVRAAGRAIEKLGGRLSAVCAVQVPGIDAQRNLVVIEKVSPTPAQYPRREGVPSKKPLQ